MRLVLLAAGKGERLRPITETRPKPLVKILEEPMICRSLRMASAVWRYDEIVVVASQRLKEEIDKINCIKEYVRDKVKVVVQEHPKGTGHAVYKAISVAGEDDIIILYSDVFIPESLWSRLSLLEPSSILVAPSERPWEYGVLKLRSSQVVDIIEKPKPDEAPSNLVFIGISVIAREHMKYISDLELSPRGEYEFTDVLLKIAKNDSLTYVNLESKEWRDIGRPWDLLLANRYALDHEIKRWKQLGDIHPTAIVDDYVYVDEGAKIGPYSVIEGPSYISKGVAIGPHTHIRPYTILLEGSKAGYSVEIKGSIIMEKARAPHFNYVGDSIVCEDVNLGAGTITANLRFDKKNVKMTLKGRRVDTGLRKLGAVIGGYAQTGINVSLMPGVKVGSYARIWPGCVVYRDVPSGEDYRC